MFGDLKNLVACEFPRQGLGILQCGGRLDFKLGTDALLDNLVERIGLEDLRSIIATLKQSMKFGTPLAESMRILAAEMRAARLARIEERAARLPVLLAIPMMLFILPCVLMVVGTPVALRVADTLKHFMH